MSYSTPGARTVRNTRKGAPKSRAFLCALDFVGAAEDCEAVITGIEIFASLTLKPPSTENPVPRPAIAHL